MKVQFLALAQKELDDTVDWYNGQATGLGRKFLDEVDRAIRRIVSFPISCPEIEPKMRRCLLVRFPYGLIYGVNQSIIVVVAVAHLHREPHYWVDRV